MLGFWFVWFFFYLVEFLSGKVRYCILRMKIHVATLNFTCTDLHVFRTRLTMTSVYCLCLPLPQTTLYFVTICAESSRSRIVVNPEP